MHERESILELMNISQSVLAWQKWAANNVMTGNPRRQYVMCCCRTIKSVQELL